jgi:hypothetical protein
MVATACAVNRWTNIFRAGALSTTWSFCSTISGCISLL